MSTRPALIANLNKPRAREIAGRLAGIFESKGARPLIEPELAQALERPDLAVPAEQIRDRADIVISLGGDGTILRSAHLVFPAVVPVLGLNLGQLGFLAHSADGTLEEVAGLALAGDLTMEDRLVIEARPGGSEAENRFALNEFVVHHGVTTRAIKVDLSLDGRRLRRFHADGIIVATPTGSTAYALAAGGPVVEPLVEALVVAPVCPHGLAERPIVVSSSHRIGLTLIDNSEPVHLVADGRPVRPLATGEEVVVARAPFAFRLASIGDPNFFGVLRDKMGWGGAERL